MRRPPAWSFLTVLVSAATLATSLSTGPANAAEKAPTLQWIWANGSPGSNETAYLRKTFTVAGKIKSGKLAATADNRISVWLNGQQVLRGDDWNKLPTVDVTKKLVDGENILAIEATNAGSAAAALAELTVMSEDGKKQVVVSDKSWLASTKKADGWQGAKFAATDWGKAHVFGPLGIGPWGSLGAVAASGAGGPQATPAERVRVPEGFQVELLYSVPKNTQGSWVSMTGDPKGRLICSDQSGGLFRVTPGRDAESTKVEPLSVAIGAAQGLLHVGDVLYVTVNGNKAQGSGLYAVRDTTGDDQYDEVKLLKRLRGGGEHGPHAIRLGPDGKLYVIAGNHTAIPEGSEKGAPHGNWAEDLLLPRNPDGNGHATNRMAPGGWIARTDLDGKNWELFCAGFRNPYDIAFNQDGELFTYDADMEWDTGAPWYRATRVNHCVPAAEFGWRFGTGKWPDYYADSLGAVVDIGLGSPTGIEFGTGAKFPARYQRALYINDWTYGKIYAVHMTPQGAGYTGTFETFIEAKPLPVTDICVNPVDQALYFTIGGRGTQSGLYRVTYVGDESTAKVGPIEDAEAAKARDQRRKIEVYQTTRDVKAIHFLWPYLNSSDRNLRYAARVAIENQDLDQWRSRAFDERRTTASIQAMIALARTGKAEVQAQVLSRLGALPWKSLTEEQTLDALRAYGLAFIRLGGKQDSSAAGVVSAISPLYPAASALVNRELCQLLTYLDAPGTIERTMKLLQSAPTQQDQLYYVFVLRNLAEKMTPDEQRAYFSWLNLAESKYRGGNSFKNFVRQIRNNALARLNDAQKTALKGVIEGRQQVEVVKLETTRQFIHNWQMDDLLPLAEQAGSGRSFAKGKAAYEATQCAKCHRFNGEGGATGPDITGVGNRFDARYLMEALVEPSKVVSDQYRLSVITTDDGEVITGLVTEESPQSVKIRTNAYDPDSTREIPKEKIDTREYSRTSEMPSGLANVLTKEEILDLIAYLRSAGKEDDEAFTK